MMKQINELAAILNEHLNWNKARVTCLAQMIKGLLAVKTVNLAEIATSFSSEARSASSYRRIQRFFEKFDFSPSMIAPLILALFPLRRRFIVIVDRTNWKLGSVHFNFLVLSIAFKGIAIPIYWQNLGKAGTSNTVERMYSVVKIIQLVGKNRISCILGDREFIGHEWFSWLAKSQIDFAIRMKSNTLVKRAPKDRLPTNITGLFRYLKPCARKFLKKPFYLGDLPIYLSASCSPKGELLVVATPRFNRKALKHYKKRWEIENLFGCLKSKGFDLEATHMCGRKKSEKLLFIVIIAFCWSYLVGIEQDLKEPIPIKTHQRKSRSLFRYGYDILRRALFQGLDILARYYRLLMPRNPRVECSC
jgi:hypothetical protein